MAAGQRCGPTRVVVAAGRLPLVAALLLVMTSCGYNLKNVKVINPCNTDLMASFGRNQNTNEWYDTVTVPAGAEVLVKNVLDDVLPTDQVLIVFGDSEDQIIGVPTAGEEPVPLVIPEAVCPGTGT